MSMGTLVQIRDVPEEVHAVLKSRAVLSGVSLSEYLRTVLERAASRPTPAELSERIRTRGVPPQTERSEVTVRRLREQGE
jgi:plasmid stability protein